MGIDFKEKSFANTDIKKYSENYDTIDCGFRIILSKEMPWNEIHFIGNDRKIAGKIVNIGKKDDVTNGCIEEIWRPHTQKIVDEMIGVDKIKVTKENHKEVVDAIFNEGVDWKREPKSCDNCANVNHCTKYFGSDKSCKDWIHKDGDEDDNREI